MGSRLVSKATLSRKLGRHVGRQSQAHFEFFLTGSRDGDALAGAGLDLAKSLDAFCTVDLRSPHLGSGANDVRISALCRPHYVLGLRAQRAGDAAPPALAMAWPAAGTFSDRRGASGVPDNPGVFLFR